MRIARTTATLLALAAAMALAPLAESATAAAPTAHDAWARAATTKMGAAYLTIRGHGSADRLVAASVPMSVAMEAQLHRSMMGDDGMMSMKHVASIAVPAKGSVALKPGGYHVMLMSLKQPFVSGKTFKLTLTFSKAGKKIVVVRVRKS